MNETKLMLSPDPGNPNAKPDFLATVEPIKLARKSVDEFNLPFEVTLDGYTREPWSIVSSASTQGEWETCHLQSTDGRNRLPGFLKYLRERKKAAFAKFEPMGVSHGQGKAILVVPFDQPAIDEVPDGVDTNQLLFVMYLRDEIHLKKKTNNAQLQSQDTSNTQQQSKHQIHQQSQKKTPPKPKPIHVMPSKKGGVLGNLLGKRQRTEIHLDMVRAPARSDPTDLSTATTGAAGVISSFRNKISSELERFSSDSTIHVTKVAISLSSLVKEVPLNERDKVTMDVLKYVVYEQVEEVGLDKWIAAKEPGGFIDECTINVYKEGQCPPEILEDLNRGELPDEIKGQARHLADSQSKLSQRKDKMKSEEMLKQNKIEECDHVTVLNTNKRDRRTLEQIQKDLLTETEDEKRRRFE
jgi:hypothetical protein